MFFKGVCLLKEAFCQFWVYCRPNRSDIVIFANKLFAFFESQFAKFCENATDGHPCNVFLSVMMNR